MGHLNNHPDRSGFAPTKKVFDFHLAHEKLLTSMTSAAEVLLVHKPLMARIDAELAGWIRGLTACHVPFDEIRLGELNEETLDGKKLVILGDAANLKPEAVQLLDDFVAQGGKLIATGMTGFRQDQQELACLGVTTLQRVENSCMSSTFLVEEKDATIWIISFSKKT